MRTIVTSNIFEASLYLSDHNCRLVNIGVSDDGSVLYMISGIHEILEQLQEEFNKGLSFIRLESYLRKFSELYKESIKLTKNERFLLKGGAL
jgi:hypothetical protein